MAVTHKKTVNFSGVAGGGQANYAWQDPNTTWIQWPPTQVGSTDEWEFIVASNGNTSQRSATIEVRHWDYANDNTLTDSFTITQAGTAPQPSYDSLSGAPDPVAEGSTLTFTVQTSNVTDGTTVPYTLSGQNIDTADIGVALQGTITINSNTGTLDVPITADQVSEGNESIICELGQTDSAGTATGGLTTNVQINDTLVDVTITIAWYEGSNTSANWLISGSSLTSGTASNVSTTANAATFTATPGATVQFTINGQTSGTDFVSVGGNDIITLANNAAGGSIISEDTSNLPEQISWIYSYTVPSQSTSSNATFDAETIADSTTETIALYGPLGSNYSCAETVVEATANYDDANGTAQNPQPAVGVNLSGVSNNDQDSYLVVAGAGASSTTGSATNLIGQIINVQDEEIMTISACVPQTGLIWATTGVDNPSTNFNTGGTGQMAYTLNRANEAFPQSVIIGVKLQPDDTLADLGQDPEVYFASDAAGTQATVPWFVSIGNINNGVSSGDTNATVTITEGDNGGGTGSSGSQGSTPGTPVGALATPEGGGSVSGSTPEGQAGAQGQAGPAPGGSNNQVYLIIKHPALNGNYVSINYTGPSVVSSTTTSPAYVFNFTTSSGSINMVGDTTAQLDFDWYDGDNINTPGPTLNTSDFNFGGGSYCNGSVTNVSQSGTTGTVTIQTIGCNSEGITQSTNVSFMRAYIEHADQANNSKTCGVTVNPCIVYGQPVAMADGSTKLIEDVVVGDVLKSAAITGLGAEEEAWKTWSTTGNDFAETAGTTTVTSVFQGSYASYYKFQFGAGQDELKTTHEHPLLTKRADNSVLFVRADEIVVGDSIYNGLDQTWKVVTAADMVSETVQTVSIDAEDNDNFFVNGLAVHNGPNQK